MIPYAIIDDILDELGIEKRTIPGTDYGDEILMNILNRICDLKKQARRREIKINAHLKLAQKWLHKDIV